MKENWTISNNYESKKTSLKCILVDNDFELNEVNNTFVKDYKEYFKTDFIGVWKIKSLK